MTKLEAEQYLSQTDWYEIVRMTTGQPIPPEIKKKREQAFKVLKQAE